MFTSTTHMHLNDAKEKIMLTFCVPFAVLLPYTEKEYKEFLDPRNEDGSWNNRAKLLAAQILHAVLVLEKTEQEIGGLRISFDSIPEGKYNRDFARSLATQIAEKGPNRVSFKQTRYVLRFAHLLQKEGLAILNHKVITGESKPTPKPVPVEKSEPSREELLAMLKAAQAKNAELTASAPEKKTTRFRAK